MHWDQRRRSHCSGGGAQAGGTCRLVTRRVWDCSLAAGGAKAAKALCRDEDVDDRGAGGDVVVLCSVCVCVCV